MYCFPRMGDGCEGVEEVIKINDFHPSCAYLAL